MKTVKSAKELIEKMKEFIKTLSDDEEFIDEKGENVSLIVSAVDKERSGLNVSATPFGVAMTIFSLFKNLAPKEKQVIILKLIAEERGIKDMPEPSANA